MPQPPFLRPGSTIGITCPSGYVTEARVLPAKALLETWGFTVKLGQTVGNQFHYFSGTDAERLADLQQMMDDPAVDAILMGRGGYGMSRIIDSLDFTEFLKKPKWVCGFSDITVIHNHIQSQYQIPTLHSPMCGHFKPETADAPFLKSFLDAITGKPLEYKVNRGRFNRVGSAKGVLTGGNLALLAHMTGSVSEVDTAGKILFIEDVGEYLYNIDRMLLNLKRAGKLSALAGLVVGGFTDMQDTTVPFGATIEEIIWDKVKDYSYPVCFGFPCGHQDINFTLMLGATHELLVTEAGSIMKLC